MSAQEIIRHHHSEGKRDEDEENFFFKHRYASWKLIGREFLFFQDLSLDVSDRETRIILASRTKKRLQLEFSGLVCTGFVSILITVALIAFKFDDTLLLRSVGPKIVDEKCTNHEENAVFSGLIINAATLLVQVIIYSYFLYTARDLTRDSLHGKVWRFTKYVVRSLWLLCFILLMSGFTCHQTRIFFWTGIIMLFSFINLIIPRTFLVLMFPVIMLIPARSVRLLTATHSIQVFTSHISEQFPVLAFGSLNSHDFYIPTLDGLSTEKYSLEVDLREEQARLKSCFLCKKQFVENEEVKLIPCSNLDYVHNNCAAEFFKRHRHCPLCGEFVMRPYFEKGLSVKAKRVVEAETPVVEQNVVVPELIEPLAEPVQVERQPEPDVEIGSVSTNVFQHQLHQDRPPSVRRSSTQF